MVDTGGEGAIGGGIAEAQGPNQVIFYIEVDDPQAVLDRIEEAGGKTVVPVTEVPDMVTFAQFADPQGNVVGLVKSTSTRRAPSIRKEVRSGRISRRMLRRSTTSSTGSSHRGRPSPPT